MRYIILQVGIDMSSSGIIAAPPGVAIEEQLLDRGMNHEEFAIEMDMSEEDIREHDIRHESRHDSRHEESTCRKFRQVQKEENRQVSR